MGEGSYGIVFAGSYDGNPVAVKRIYLSANIVDVDREVHLHKELNHGNVLKLLHVDVEQDNRDFKYLENNKYYILISITINFLKNPPLADISFSSCVPEHSQIIVKAITMGLLYRHTL